MPHSLAATAASQGAANGLLGILVGIEVVLLGLWTALGGGDNVVGVFKKILHIGAWVWIVQSYPSLCKAFVDSLIKPGMLAGGGGGDVSLIMDPSRIAGYGLDATEPLAKKIEDLHITEFADGIVYGISYLAIMGCFLIMAIQVFLAVLEYYLITAVVGILMPFGLLKSTKFLAEKAIGAVVAVGIKLMVLSFILASIEPVLEQHDVLGATRSRSTSSSRCFSPSARSCSCAGRRPSLAGEPARRDRRTSAPTSSCCQAASALHRGRRLDGRRPSPGRARSGQRRRRARRPGDRFRGAQRRGAPHAASALERAAPSAPGARSGDGAREPSARAARRPRRPTHRSS